MCGKLTAKLENGYFHLGLVSVAYYIQYVAAAVASAAPLLPPSASAISAADPRQAGFGRQESHSRPSS